MSFIAALRKKDPTTHQWVDAFIFPTNPFAAPELSYNYDDQEPPVLVSITKTWTIEAMLYGGVWQVGGGEQATAAAWTALVNSIEAGTAQILGLQLRRGNTVVEEVSVEAGYYGVKIDTLSSPRTDQQWRLGNSVKLRVSGTKFLAAGGNTVSKLTQTLAYSYDEDGLLTETLSGEVTVTTGSAEAIARTFGLALPSSNFAYVTSGPEGVDIELVDRTGLTARFTSVIRESGSALPGGVGPGFSVEIETTNIDGDDVTTTTVTAQGPNAVSAVKSKRPAGRLLESQSKNDYQRTAKAVYVVKKAAPNATPLKRRNFTTTGGGRSVKWTRRTGGRKPKPHIGSFAEVVIDEVIVLERAGAPALLLNNDQIFPPPLGGGLVVEDTGAFRIDGGPDLIEKGKDPSGDRWQIRVHRRYTAADFFDAYLAVTQAAVAVPQDNSSTIGGQMQARPVGKD